MASVLIVDGYNIIHAWSSLEKIVRNGGLDAARDQLIDDLEDYAGSTHTKVIVVFDAYHTDRLILTQRSRNNVEVVFTRQKETADHYIERLVSGLDTRQYDIQVATSDGVEQVVVMGRGAARISAREFERVVLDAKRIRDIHMKNEQAKHRHTIESMLDPDTLETLKKMVKEEN